MQGRESTVDGRTMPGFGGAAANVPVSAMTTGETILSAVHRAPIYCYEYVFCTSRSWIQAAPLRITCDLN